MNEISGQPETKTESVPEKVKKGIMEEFNENPHKGEFVEKKWMEGYQRIIDALDPGKRKTVAEQLRPMAVAVAKANKIGAGIADFVLKVQGVLEMGTGLLRTVSPNTLKPANRSTGEIRQWGLQSVVIGGVHEAVGARSGVEYASGFMADILGQGGEKIAQISNKILRKNAPLPVAPAKA